ncbi:MAG: MBL fold metallo-hydrolase [Aeromicrobium sp.]
MRIDFCGVRGSTPAPGPEFVRYGGNTSCVAIARNGEDPTLLLDAGTGLSRVSRLIDGRPFRGTLLIGHLHWDHTHGLPFFHSGDQPGAAIRMLIPQQEGGTAEELLARAMSPPHFPILPGDLRGSWSFGYLDEGEHEIEGFTVHAREIPHKGGRTFGYRVSDGEHTVAYLSDHWPGSLGDGPDGFGPYHEAALSLAKDADVLIHDAQYTAEEYPGRRTFGHSTIDYAQGMGVAAGVGRVVLFHHDPRRTDDELDVIAHSFATSPIDVTAACEEQTIRLLAGSSIVETATTS